jgi:hypothetical protein
MTNSSPVIQADREAASSFMNSIEPVQWAGTHDPITMPDDSVSAQAFAKHRCDALAQAAAYHTAKARKWRKEAAKHTRADGRRSDHEDRDLERAKRHEADAIAILALRNQGTDNGN